MWRACSYLGERLLWKTATRQFWFVVLPSVAAAAAAGGGDGDDVIVPDCTYTKYTLVDYQLY